MEVKLKLIPSEKGRKISDLPKMATAGSAGVDFRANIDERIKIAPGEFVLVPTGLATEFEPGVVLMIFPRSGFATKKGLVLQNGTGIIDSDYRNEIFVPLRNSSNLIQVVEPDDRIAQGIFLSHCSPTFSVEDDLSETERKGGFGHTGNN